jgi:ribosomal protein S14
MIFSQFKDKQLRSDYLKTEHKTKINKFLNINILSKLSYFKNKNFKQICIIKSNLGIKKKFFKTKIVRRSLFADHSKNNNRKLNFSRFVFRDLLKFGLVPGYKKAVW